MSTEYCEVETFWGTGTVSGGPRTRRNVAYMLKGSSPLDDHVHAIENDMLSDARTTCKITHAIGVSRRRCDIRQSAPVLVTIDTNGGLEQPGFDHI